MTWRAAAIADADAANNYAAAVEQRATAADADPKRWHATKTLKLGPNGLTRMTGGDQADEWRHGQGRVPAVALLVRAHPIDATRRRVDEGCDREEQ